MKFSTYLDFLNQYKKIFYKYYYKDGDKSSIVIDKHMLSNKINNYINHQN